MSAPHEPLSEFERNARTVLEESVLRIDGRTRSRLNQARHAALEASLAPRRSWWRSLSLSLMPAAGAAAAALLVAVMLWHREPGDLPLDAQRPVVEDMDLLADSDALELVEGGDGSFYEWAATQSDSGESG